MVFTLMPEALTEFLMDYNSMQSKWFNDGFELTLGWTGIGVLG